MCQTENVRCVNRALIKLAPLKCICINALFLTALLYLWGYFLVDLYLLKQTAVFARQQKSLAKFSLKARTHRDEYQRALFASVFQRVFCVHTQAIFADDEPSEHANSFPDIRWSLM